MMLNPEKTSTLVTRSLFFRMLLFLVGVLHVFVKWWLSIVNLLWCSPSNLREWKSVSEVAEKGNKTKEGQEKQTGDWLQRKGLRGLFVRLWIEDPLNLWAFIVRVPTGDLGTYASTIISSPCSVTSATSSTLPPTSTGTYTSRPWSWETSSATSKIFFPPLLEPWRVLYSPSRDCLWVIWVGNCEGELGSSTIAGATSSSSLGLREEVHIYSKFVLRG